MKKKDLPQDKSALENFTREVHYVKNENDKYDTALSEGWDVKKQALDNAWDDFNEKIEAARKAVKEGTKSPIFYYMEKCVMDVNILAAYSGQWKITVKRHFKPSAFQKLSARKLHRYAEIFDITVDQLKNFKG